jgi:hypothetical protein
MKKFKDFVLGESLTEEDFDKFIEACLDSKFVTAMDKWFEENYPDVPIYAGNAVPEDYIEYLDEKGDKKMVKQFVKDMKKYL